MEYKRVHFIKEVDGWIVYYCDTVTYKKININEKECYENILNGVSEKEFYREFPDIDKELYKKCKEELIENGVVADQIPEEKIRLTLNVANACNMNCGYCYANGGTYHSTENLMTMDVAKKAIDIFAEKFGEIGSVKFIGGEPLLNKSVVLGVCDYVKEKLDAGVIKEMPDFIIATNGTLLDDEIIQYSIKYNWRVGLSFDGPEKVHDHVRTFNNGDTTAGVIKKNIHRWQEATGGRLPSSINACYSGVHQKYGSSVTDAVKYMKEEFGIEKINIVPVDASHASEFALSDDTCFVRAVKEILDPSSENYKKYRFTKMKSLEKILRSHLSMPATICKAGLTTFGISTKGVISPCHLLTDESNFFMGTVFDEDVFDKDTFTTMQKKLGSYDRFKNEYCKNCFANRICPGCLGGNLFRCGDLSHSDPVICEMVKRACEETIKDIVRNSEGDGQYVY